MIARGIASLALANLRFLLRCRPRRCDLLLLRHNQEFQQ
jgi:hypothetical protein